MDNIRYLHANTNVLNEGEIMAYNTIAYATTREAYQYVTNNWVNSTETTFLKKQVLARGAFLALAPASLITIGVDTILGIGSGIAAICTLGKHKPIRKFASRHIVEANELFAVPYRSFLKAINPIAKLDFTSGYMVTSLTQPLFDMADICKKSDNYLKKQVASRLTYALTAIACLVTSVVDGIFSLSFVALSILTAGKLKDVNNLAYKSLKAPGVIDDLYYLTLVTINPWVFEQKA
jgi:hypothetical protein